MTKLDAGLQHHCQYLIQEVQQPGVVKGQTLSPSSVCVWLEVGALSNDNNNNCALNHLTMLPTILQKLYSKTLTPEYFNIAKLVLNYLKYIHTYIKRLKNKFFPIYSKAIDLQLAYKHRLPIHPKN